MNSIAVWYEETKNPENSEVPCLDIHVNHWKLKYRINFFLKGFKKLYSRTLGKIFDSYKYHDSDFFMDIGLKIVNGSSVQKICVYIPYKYTDKGFIEDLGCKLRSVRMLTAIFNEPLTFNSLNAKNFEVQKDGKPLLNIYELSTENDIDIFNEYNGTILKFKHRQFGNLPTYYRFRLKSGFLNNLSLTYTPSNFLFESAYSKIEVTDFRINDSRNLDVSLLELINGKKRFNLALVHYFVMRSLKDDYIISNQKLNSVRQLEKNTWSTYITENEYRFENSFAYHLKMKAIQDDSEKLKYIDDFTAVFKFQYEHSKLLLYVFCFLILALLIELAGNTSYDYLSGKLIKTDTVNVTSHIPVKAPIPRTNPLNSTSVSEYISSADSTFSIKDKSSTNKKIDGKKD